MKRCSHCLQILPSTEFNKDNSRSDGLRHKCKGCILSYKRTKIGKISTIYLKQVCKSKDRGHNPPYYSKEEFIVWCLGHDIFHALYEEWKKNNFSTRLAPSCDRVDDSKGYSFDNIQLMSWAENGRKGNYDRKNGVLVTKQMRAVLQLSLKRRNIIAEYPSIALAARAVGGNFQNISNCCNGAYRYSSGFIWEYK